MYPSKLLVLVSIKLVFGDKDLLGLAFVVSHGWILGLKELSFLRGFYFDSTCNLSIAFVESVGGWLCLVTLNFCLLWRL